MTNRQTIPDLASWLGHRATVRKYNQESSLPDEEIREIIDAGRKAPTSGTTQMYSFLWVQDPTTRQRIHELCNRGTAQIEEANHFLLVCIDIRRIKHLLEQSDRDFALSPMMALLEGSIDASLAAQSIMTVAESRGYGVCPIGNILNNLDQITCEMDLPDFVLPIYGLCIGVPEDEAPYENCPRVPLDAILHIDEYDDLSPDLLDRCYDEMNSMYGESVYGDQTRTWDETLERYWGPKGFMNKREATLCQSMSQQGFFNYKRPCESTTKQNTHSEV